MNWFYSKNNRQEGPVSDESIRSKISMGELSGSDLAWTEGMADWQPLSKISEFQEAFAPRSVTAEYPTATSPVETPSYSTPAAAPVPTYTQPVGVPVRPPSTALHITSLVCGIIALLTFCVWCLSGPLAIAAIITGHLGLGRSKTDAYNGIGKGMAITGLITGYLAIVVTIVVTIGANKLGSMTPEEMKKLGFPPEVIQSLEQRQHLIDKARESQDSTAPDTK